MALPTTISSFNGEVGHHPPYKSSGGAFYATVAESSDILQVYKATDPTDSWVLQDDAGNSDAETILFATVQDGDLIHIASASSISSTIAYRYSSFNMATDAWVVIDELIETPDPGLRWISIAVRSDGDVVVAYNGGTDSVMGGAKRRVDYNVRTVTTWGGPVALDAAGDIHYGNANCVLGTNDFVHCIWQTTANTTDPPTSWTDTEGRSIDPADDSASTVDSSDATSASLSGYPNIVTYDDGGTQRIIVSGFIANGTSLETAQATEDGSDEILLTATGVTEDFTSQPCKVVGKVGICTFVDLSGDIHCLYSGGGTAGVDQDLFYSTSTDNGDSWAAPTEEIDAITANFISANIYVRGADTVLAYVYDDGGAQKYNEKVLIAGGANFVKLLGPGGLVMAGGLLSHGGGLVG